MNTHSSSRLKKEKIVVVALLVAICLISAIAIGIPNTIAKKDSKEPKTGFRKSDNPILNLPVDEENWLPIVPPEPVERPLDEEVEQDLEMLIYDIKTKKTKKILKNLTKSDKTMLILPGSQGSLPSELVPESVFLPDDRVLISPTTNYPWRSIVKLFMTFPSGNSMGSGFIFGESHVLTAGHCVYDPFLGEWATSIEVIPAYDGGYMPFSNAWATNMTVSWDWYDYGYYEEDFAIITLDRNIGGYTGWMGLYTSLPSDPIYTSTLNTAGYPGDLYGGERMYFDSDWGAGADEYNHWYYMDTYGGQSGSAVWSYDGTTHYVLSIHAYGEGGLWPGKNMGTRLSEYWFGIIDEVLLDSIPPLDYANLIDEGQAWSGFSPTTVVPGVSDFSVWSGTRNIGTIASGDFSVSYYASTDQTITDADYLIGNVSVTSIEPYWYFDSEWTGIFPSDIPGGTYWVGWIIDSNNDVLENLYSGETDNIAYKDSYQLEVALAITDVEDIDGNPISSGIKGDTVVVKGSGATPDAEVNLYWDYVTMAGLVNTTEANVDGNFELWFKVPEAVNGDHYLWVKDTGTGLTSSWGPFTVVSTITLDVENGPVGTVVTVSGSGFTAEGTVDNITINGGSCTIIDAIAIDDIGKFKGAFVIPSVENVGIHEITLTDSNGLEANNDFLITGLAEIEIDQFYGVPGTNVSIHGYNFSALSGEEVVVEIWDESWNVMLAVFDTDANGEFSGFFIIPAIPFDDYLILAVQDQYNINATCDFRLGIIAMIINPTRGPTGTQVQISGVGFTPFGEWNATFGDITIFQNEPVDESGMISDVFNVPEVELGTYFINVTDGETEIEIYTLFDVIPPGPYAIFNFDEYVTIRTDGDSVPSGLHGSRSDTYLKIRNKDDEFDEVLGGLSYQIEAENIENVNWDEYADWSSTQSNWTFPTEYSLLENEQESVWSSVTGDIQLNTTVTRWMNQTIFSEDGHQRVNYTVSFTENHPQWSGYEGLINVETDQYLSATIVPGSFSTDAPLDYYTEEFLIIEFVFNRFAIENDVNYNFTFVTRIDLEEWAIPPIVYKPEIILYKNLGQGFELSDEAKKGVIPPEALPDYIYSAQVSTNITNVWWQYWNRDLYIELARVEESTSPLAGLYFQDSSSFWTNEDTLSAGEHNISSDCWLNIWNKDDDSDTVLGDLSYYVEADNITNIYPEQYADWSSTSSNWTFPPEYYIEEDGSNYVYFHRGESPVLLNFSLERWMNETTFSEDGYQRANFTLSFTNTDFVEAGGNIAANDHLSVNASIVPGSIQTDAPLEYLNEDLNWIYFDFNRSSLLAGVEYNFTVLVKVELTGEIAPPVLYKPGFTVVNNIDYGYASGGVGYVAEMPPEALPDYLYAVRASTNTSNSWELQGYNAIRGELNEVVKEMGPRARLSYTETPGINTDDDNITSGTHQLLPYLRLDIWNREDDSDTVLGDLSYYIEANNITWISWEEYADWSSTSSNWTFPPEYYLEEWSSRSVAFEDEPRDYMLNSSIERWMNETIFTEDGFQRANFTVSFTNTDFVWAWCNIATDDRWGVNASIVPGSFYTDAPIDWMDEYLHSVYFGLDSSDIVPGVEYNFSMIVKVELTGDVVPPILYKPEFVMAPHYEEGSMAGGEGYVAAVPSELLPEYVYTAQVSTNTSNVWEFYWIREVRYVLDEVVEESGPRASLYLSDSSRIWTDEDTISAGEHNISSDCWLNIWNKDDDSDTVLGDLSYYIEANNITSVSWEEYADWSSTSSNWTFPPQYYIEEYYTHYVDFQLGERPVSLNFSLERWMNETTFSEDGHQQVNFTVSFTNTDSSWCYGYIEAWESWGVNVSFVPGSVQTDAPLEYLNEDLNWIYFDFNMSSLLAGVEYNFTVLVKVELTGEIAPPVLYKPGFTVGNEIDYGYASGGVGYVAEMPPEALPDYLYAVRASTNTSNGWELSWSRALQGYLNASTRYISAEIILDVSEGPVGSVIEVNGTGFTPEGNITRISIDSLNCTIISTDDIDTDGNFSTSIVIPSINNTGIYDIEVVDDGERSAIADFEVTGLSEIIVDPIYGPPGTTVSVHGYNYSAIQGETVSIELWDKDPLEWRMDLETFTTDADGEFSGSLNIPAAPFDDYLILAVQDLYNINATCDFRLGIIAIIINPTRGPTGTQVQLTGTGFTPYGEWNATIGDTPIFTNETVSSDGTIEGTSFVPTLDVGTYDVTVLDVETEIEFTTEFVVTAMAEVYLDPVEAPSGYNVTIGGRYFAAEEGIGLQFTIYNSTGAWPMDVRQGNPGTPAVTDSDGNFTAWWIIPQLTAGDYIVNVTDAEGIWAQREFTARAPEIISISVDPGDIDFGTIYEGGSGTSSVTITNDGNVEVSVIATLGSEVPVGFYTSNFKLDDLAVSGWSINNLGPGASEPVALRIDIPVSTEPGSKTAILIFWAEIP